MGRRVFEATKACLTRSTRRLGLRFRFAAVWRVVAWVRLVFWAALKFAPRPATNRKAKQYEAIRRQVTFSLVYRGISA